ncbi:3126_t:CDS:2 [Paraglomus occultum]|uniref:3126_t:CDS:1 n=1 Tax=Paraglomus occultum TaxID=144539 RepID=A0A9N8W746_9GLOM|nr:3126_t:CDS:2 [Paraglomus occultum]
MSTSKSPEPSSSSERGLKFRKRWEDNSYWERAKKGPVSTALYLSVVYPKVFFNHKIRKTPLNTGWTLYQETVIRALKWSADSPLGVSRRAANFIESIGKARCSEPLTTVTNVPGVQGHWIGPETWNGRKAEAILFYVHGGGYVTFSSLCSLRPLCYLLKTLRKKHNKHVRVLSIDYPLAPENPYPQALNYAENAYRWLTTASGLPGGDSAGGGLALSLLQSLYKDSGSWQNSIDAKNMPMPLGAILVSPWVELKCDAASYITNAKYDTLPVHFCPFAAEYYIYGYKRSQLFQSKLKNKNNDKKSDVNKREDSFRTSNSSATGAEFRQRNIKNKYTDPYKNPMIAAKYAPLELLAKFPPLLISYGGKEIFRDDIEEFVQKCVEAKKLKQEKNSKRLLKSDEKYLHFEPPSSETFHPEVQVEYNPEMVHIYPFLDFLGEHSREALDRFAGFITARLDYSKHKPLILLNSYNSQNYME